MTIFELKNETLYLQKIDCIWAFANAYHILISRTFGRNNIQLICLDLFLKLKIKNRPIANT